MRICLVHEEYPEETNFGGIATYQKRIAEEYVKCGHEVFVVARGLEKDQYYEENGVKITRIFVSKTEDQIQDYTIYRKRVAQKLKELQDNEQIDIIEVPDWGAETVFFEDFRKVPLIVRLHTPLKVWLKFNKNNFGDVTNILLAWEDKMLKRADLVTCCSKILKRMVVKDFKIPAKDILVTPNPANLDKFFKDKSINKENRILYVGSLEERKGVCVLAKALNRVFKKHPNIQVDFIGKDTTRNNKNISTIEYVKQIIDNRYIKNLHFLGQKKNEELNEYYNRSLVAVFPSLFDNFPYVVLEAMATGVQIVGSKNSGMIEMLADKFVYETPDYKDLANKILEKVEAALENPYNEENIKRVNNKFSAKIICNAMLDLYSRSINNYRSYYISFEDIQNVLKLGGRTEELKSIQRQFGGVAHAVYKAETKGQKFIIKRYNSNVDFDLSKELYSRYNSVGLRCVEQINKKPIVLNGKNFNIYPYIDGVKLKENLVENLKTFILVDRRINMENNILNKCNFYYDGIKRLDRKFSIKGIEFVLETYEKIKDFEMLKERYINHGDISKTNLILNENGLNVIDFDETTIAPMLYDFAVICIKFFVSNGKLKTDLYNQMVEEITSKTKYLKEDCDLIMKFYLCKILLEKFFLHEMKKIDLFSKDQKRDDYKKYFKLLQSLI